jgi:hypothetical protein
MADVEGLLGVLQELKNKDERISACMIAKKGLEGLMMFPESFKADVAQIWEPLSENINMALSQICSSGEMGLKRAYIEILGYGIFFRVISQSDTAVVVLANDENPTRLTDKIIPLIDEAESKICAIISKGD